MDVTWAHRPVVAGVDGSASALDAVVWAAGEAARRRVALRLVTAFGWVDEHPVGHPAAGAAYRDELREAAARHLDEAVAAARSAAPGLEVGHEVVVGYPMGVLAAEARAAQLLVVGDRSRGGFAGLLLGSVAVAMAAHAACPVVVVRGGEPDSSATRPVVVGVDGSPTGEAALAFAYEAAAVRGAALVAVHAWADSVADVPVAALVDWAAVEQEERQVLAERLAGWAEKYPDVAVQRVVVRAHPVPALVERTRGAQLLVVGSRGRGGLAGLLLGSVSHGVLHRSHCPVAVVRPDTGAPR
jgi:nucleotide-binding universal stress UspA family protein